jgi:hypothetical protein
MEKISNEQIQEVLAAVPGALRKMAEERDFWKQEAQQHMRRDDAEKVAHAMHSKGINADTDFSELVVQLEKAAEQGKLSNIADAVDMVGPDMGQKIASLAGENGPSVTGGSSDLVRFILGGVG